jgi:transcriptional repressor NF-X1
MPVYYCYCGRFSEPYYDHLLLPHSCGEYCNKQKNKDCKHDNCEILCHPGACPPCNINVPVPCHCGKQTQRAPCHISKRTKHSCQELCQKALNCGKHQCERVCHEGECDPCALTQTQKCFCGNTSSESLCGTKTQSCKRACGKQLDCSKHDCEKICHSGPCDPCQKDPQRVRYCPSGHNTIEKLLGR